MPEYPWLFDGSPDRPSKRGLALITYVQWLGSWLESYPYYEDYQAIPVADVEARRRRQDDTTHRPPGRADAGDAQAADHDRSSRW